MAQAAVERKAREEAAKTIFGLERRFTQARGTDCGLFVRHDAASNAEPRRGWTPLLAAACFPELWPFALDGFADNGAAPQRASAVAQFF